MKKLNLSEGDRRALQRMYPKADNLAVDMLIAVAERTGLDPLAGQLQMTQYGIEWKAVTTTDGLRLIAERTGRYAGSDEPTFDGAGRIIDLLAKERKQPRTATVTVYKLINGVRCPFTATTRWEEFRPQKGGSMWDRMPFHMLAKTAEAQALRKAFPAELADLGVEGVDVDEIADTPAEADELMDAAEPDTLGSMPASAPPASRAPQSNARPEVSEGRAPSPRPTPEPPAPTDSAVLEFRPDRRVLKPDELIAALREAVARQPERNRAMTTEERIKAEEILCLVSPVERNRLRLVELVFGVTSIDELTDNQLTVLMNWAGFHTIDDPQLGKVIEVADVVRKEVGKLLILKGKR